MWMQPGQEGRHQRSARHGHPPRHPNRPGAFANVRASQRTKLTRTSTRKPEAPVQRDPHSEGATKKPPWQICRSEPVCPCKDMVVPYCSTVGQVRREHLDPLEIDGPRMACGSTSIKVRPEQCICQPRYWKCAVPIHNAWKNDEH